MFDVKEIGAIVKAVGTKMSVRLTPYGNVVIKHRDSVKVLFSLYKREDGFLIRRRLGYDNPSGSGNVLNGGKTFPTLGSAMKYFKSYCEKHPKSLIG